MEKYGKLLLGLGSVIMMVLAIYEFNIGATDISILFTLWAIFSMLIEGKL